MGVIAERMAWETEKDRLKTYLRLPTLPPADQEALDEELRMFLAVAIEMAEQYVGKNLDYLNDPPPKPLPEAVRLWCYRYVNWRFERREEQRTMSTLRGGESVTWEEEPDYSLLARWRTIPI